MRRLTIIILAALPVLSSPVIAADQPDSLRTYQQPALLTSCGQAADVLIIKGQCARAGISIKYRPTATADSISDVKCIIIVAGGSSKGLGAAKADASHEEERIKKLLKAAKKEGLPVIVFHTGGEARRGALSDPFNRLAAEGAELLVIAKDGDADGFFRKIADKSKARYIPISDLTGVIGVLQTLFPKPKTTTPQEGG